MLLYGKFHWSKKGLNSIDPHCFHMQDDPIFFACWVIFHVLLSSAKLFMSTITVSYGLDPDQDRHCVASVLHFISDKI